MMLRHPESSPSVVRAVWIAGVMLLVLAGAMSTWFAVLLWPPVDPVSLIVLVGPTPLAALVTVVFLLRVGALKRAPSGVFANPTRSPPAASVEESASEESR